jgi:hypothetical protein
MGGCESVLDCIVIIQPDLGWRIIVNFITKPCIVSAKATICLCFTEGALLDRRTTLDNLVVGMKLGCFGIRTQDISSGGAELVKNRIGVMRSFGGSWKSAFITTLYGILHSFTLFNLKLSHYFSFLLIHLCWLCSECCLSYLLGRYYHSKVRPISVVNLINLDYYLWVTGPYSANEFSSYWG